MTHTTPLTLAGQSSAPVHTSATQMQVETFFDAVTETFSHVVHSGPGSACAIIDPVLDYDPASGHTSTKALTPLLDFVERQQLQVAWILETHAHADHLSAAAQVRAQVGGRIGIGAHIREVQALFKDFFHLGADFPTDGRPFDHLFAEGETFEIGPLTATAWHVPGHTPADMAYLIGDAVFVGDTLFMPDVGTARCDFPGGSAHQLYRSIRRILALPDDTRLYLCHDYPPKGRAHCSITTVGAQRQHNIHVHDGIDEATFVHMRHARDATLAMPRLIMPAVQVNIRAGHLPEPEANGVRYLKIALDRLGHRHQQDSKPPHNPP